LIHLDDAIFSSIGAVLDASEFHIGAAAADAGDRIITTARRAPCSTTRMAPAARRKYFATLDPGLALSMWIS
jgi:hypothetical protein